ncbi:MAG: hypothetical protein JF588_02015 [Caulobacterales bacterium]|nr:hypothetical protein [Caulobacterales bacterium]
MAKRAQKDDDPQVTDLGRYRKQREAAARKAKPPRTPNPSSFLGANPRAGLILAAVVLLVLAIYVLPRFLH